MPVPTARVFIWYPADNHIGHASMYIGNYEVGRKFEMSLDPGSPQHVMPSALETSMGAGGVHYNDNYVSWWPEDRAGLTSRHTAAPMLGLYQDVDSEDSQPHAVYDVFGLDVAAMRTRWHATRDKRDTTYQLIRKNCAGIVARVLNAGGAGAKLGFASRMWFAHRAIWTPKKVAQMCNQLRDKGLAEKTKAGNCPEKDSFLMGALGLR